MEKEKKEKTRKRKEDNEKIEARKNFNKGNKKTTLKEANYQQKKILAITVRNLRIQRTVIQSGMKMCTKMSAQR